MKLNHKPEICDFCHIGEIVEKRLTYTERLQTELILVSNVPGRVCSYCGERRYDPLVMSALRRLLLADLERPEDSHGTARHYGYRIDSQMSINKGQFPLGEN